MTQTTYPVATRIKHHLLSNRSTRARLFMTCDDPMYFSGKSRAYAKQMTDAAKTILSDNGYDMKNLWLRFSRTAGCRCGCSPGIIVDGYDPKISRGSDIFIDFRMEKRNVAA